MMHRRRFFGLVVAPFIARLLPTPQPTPLGINRAEFTFWRNQELGVSGADHLRVSMRSIYNKCSVGIGTPDVLICSDAVALKLGKLIDG